MNDFEPFPPIRRDKLFMHITEKIDGTNAQVYIKEILGNTSLEDDGWDTVGELDGYYAMAHPQRGYVLVDTGATHMVRIGSRKRWIFPDKFTGKGSDNFGFAHWVTENIQEISKLGNGRHFGEWYGAGVQKCYPSVTTKNWALFNTARHARAFAARQAGHDSDFPACCELVPTLYHGDYNITTIETVMAELASTGSVLCNGDPAEGIVVTIPRTDYKQKLTFNYAEGKWKQAAA